MQNYIVARVNFVYYFCS